MREACGLGAGLPITSRAKGASLAAIRMTKAHLGGYTQTRTARAISRQGDRRFAVLPRDLKGEAQGAPQDAEAPERAGGPHLQPGGRYHTYAALDLGTNNCRLLIARPET